VDDSNDKGVFLCLCVWGWLRGKVRQVLPEAELQFIRLVGRHFLPSLKTVEAFGEPAATSPKVHLDAVRDACIRSMGLLDQ